jgi:serine/threonine protein phosphatase PrpC
MFKDLSKYQSNMTLKPPDIYACSQIGTRDTQEDRYLVVPDIGPDIQLLCVMDGTVGDFVAQRATDIFETSLKQSKSWNRFISTYEDVSLLENSMREAFEICDTAIITECKKNSISYTACTLVACILIKGKTLVTAHIGDSRAALIHKQGEYVWGEFLTRDHRPDMSSERDRIQKSGGAVVYLASRGLATPFIRGGDFKARRAAGETPMQLQYSRALGGKDLKPFGLSHEPDVRITNLIDSDYGVVLATDGLWDKLTASQAAKIVTSHKENSAQVLVRSALSEPSDNVTAIVLIFTR